MATATEVTPNTVVVEETSPTTRRITITIPADAVNARIETSFGALQLETAVPGFRKGKAPRSLLEKRFGGAVLQETRSALVGDAYSKAIEEKSIRPVTDPELTKESMELALERGKPFTFSVDIEVVPNFDVPSVEGLSIKKPVAEVGAEHIDQEILRQRYRWGTPNRIEEPLQHLDRMIGRAEVRIEGADDIFFETEQALVVVPAIEDEGKGQLLGLLIDDLDKALLGKVAGDTVEVSTVGPEYHEREEVRGKKLTIKYTIRAAERITPAEVSALVEKFGLGTEEIFREQIKFALEQRRDGEQLAAQREQIFEWLLDQVHFDLPPKLSERQVSRSIARQRLDLLQRGLDENTVEQRLAELRGQSEEQARSRLRLFFILARLAEQYGVQVTEQEVAGRIHQIAQSQNMRPDQVRQQLSRTGAINDVALQIREQKTADRILEKANVSDVSADDWNKDVQSRAEEKAKVLAKGKSDAKPGKSSK
ncbi:MAG: trigger factor [Phycisphaerae bacterium]|jgi:trigger factor|nr:trigger factor [Phycisphaerae bacterium]